MLNSTTSYQNTHFIVTCMQKNIADFVHVTDCSRICPQGCILSTTVCGVCEATESITGKVTDCDSGNPIGNVEVFVGDNLLESLVETDVTGSFQLTNMCVANLELYFYKYGYTSEQESYAYSASGMEIKMCANCRYI